MKSGGASNKKYTLPELVQIVERYEEKANASAKTEVSFLYFFGLGTLLVSVSRSGP